MSFILGDFSSSPTAQKDTSNIDNSVIYDTLIVGLGPAGVAASIYCARKELKIMMIGEHFGGLMLDTLSVENWPGESFIQSHQLIDKFRAHVDSLSVPVFEGYFVHQVVKKDNLFEVVITVAGVQAVSEQNSTVVKAKSVILATGSSPRKIGIPGEKEFTGKGVAYCATCDAPLFKNKSVVVLGGGNSGVEAAIELANLAKKVTLLHRGKALTADPILQKQLRVFSNVNIVTEAEIRSIEGKEEVEKVTYLDKKTQEIQVLENIDGVFVQIGFIPNTSIHFEPEIHLSERKEVTINAFCHTNVPGLFAAGDVTDVFEKQIIIAAGEGAKAALSCYKYLIHTKE